MQWQPASSRFAGNTPVSSHEVACLGGLLATAAIASCFEVCQNTQLLEHVRTEAGHAGHADIILQILEVLAPTRVFSLPGWGTTACDVAMLEHTTSFATRGMPPLLVAAPHHRDAPDLGPLWPWPHYVAGRPCAAVVPSQVLADWAAFRSPPHPPQKHPTPTPCAEIPASWVVTSA